MPKNIKNATKKAQKTQSKKTIRREQITPSQKIKTIASKIAQYEFTIGLFLGCLLAIAYLNVPNYSIFHESARLRRSLTSEEQMKIDIMEAVKKNPAKATEDMEERMYRLQRKLENTAQKVANFVEVSQNKK